jgi:predicted AAA+ superfamily ATPase
MKADIILSFCGMPHFYKMEDAMEIERPFYLKRLLRLKDNGRIKIITGMRRAGKSYLLFELFRRELHKEGVPEDCVISISLDELANARERNPLA